MPFIDMHDYSPAARRYWWTVAILGMAVLAYSIAHVVSVDGKFLLQVMIGATVAAIVGLFPVRIPGAKTSIAGAEIFIFLVLLLYGTEAAVIAAALEGVRRGVPHFQALDQPDHHAGHHVARDLRRRARSSMPRQAVPDQHGARRWSRYAPSASCTS